MTLDENLSLDELERRRYIEGDAATVTLVARTEDELGRTSDEAGDAYREALRSIADTLRTARKMRFAKPEREALAAAIELLLEDPTKHLDEALRAFATPKAEKELSP